jgi:hypothetical protein
VVNARLVFREVNPDHTTALVVRKSKIRLAVSINVAKCAALCVIGVSDLFGLPHLSGSSGFRPRIAIPPKAIGNPGSGNKINKMWAGA